MSVIHWNEQTELVKDPADEVFKHFSYERWLVGDALLDEIDFEIGAVEDDDADPLTFDNDSITNAGVYATLRLLGGTAGRTYTLTITVYSNETPRQRVRFSVDVVVRAR